MTTRRDVPIEDFRHRCEADGPVAAGRHFGVSKTSAIKWAKLMYDPRSWAAEPPGIELHQASLIVGSLLGDGSLTKSRGPGHNVSLSIVHGEAQVDYLEWKASQLSPLAGEVTRTERPAMRRSGRTISHDPGQLVPQFTVATIRHPHFTAMERNWYARTPEGTYVLRAGRRVKVVPPELRLDPLSLAIWYCDDGSLHAKGRAARFASMSFTTEECWRLVDELNRLGIPDCTVWSDRQIYVPRPSFSAFISVVEPCVPVCMSRKITRKD